MMYPHTFDVTSAALVDPAQAALSHTKASQTDHICPCNIFLAIMNNFSNEPRLIIWRSWKFFFLPQYPSVLQGLFFCRKIVQFLRLLILNWWKLFINRLLPLSRIIPRKSFFDSSQVIIAWHQQYHGGYFIAWLRSMVLLKTVQWRSCAIWPSGDPYGRLVHFSFRGFVNTCPWASRQSL